MAGQSRSRPNSGYQQQQQQQTKKKDNMQSKNKTRATTMTATTTSSTTRSSTTAPDWSPSSYTVLKALLSARLCSAVWGIVSDCDETYNYWEPTHYLIYGWGFQTWEYDPQFALRSYFYLLLHAIPAWVYSASVTTNRMLVYFFVRCMLAVMCSACELYFYRGCLAVYGARVARVTLCLMLFSAGMFAACTAYLPSSFALQAVACAMGAWLHRQYQLTILCIAVASLLGWPFVALVGVPIAFDIVVRKHKGTLFVKWSLISAFVILMPMLQVDTNYYGKLTVAPLNLVMYNVFTSHGADLYGTEPWTYYLYNGFLNFNVAFILALVAVPLYALSRRYATKPQAEPVLPVWLCLAPLYLWLAVFGLQAHKEERFMYPVYPLVCLAAAIAIDSCQQLCAMLPWRRAAAFAATVALALLVAICAVSVSRVVAQYRGYHASTSIFLELQQLPPAEHTTRLCLAKDWYRYPSSFFLPDDKWEMRFVQSEFRGQLPQPFLPSEGASSQHRDNFNGLNKEESDRYVRAETCHYLIDRDTPGSGGLEHRYSALTDTWRPVASVPMLDAARSPRLLRAFYIPFLTERFCSYNNYTLLQNIAGVKGGRRT